jgi:hypothetical protein
MEVGAAKPPPPPMGVLGAGASSPDTGSIVTRGRVGSQEDSENGEFTPLGSSERCRVHLRERLDGQVSVRVSSPEPQEQPHVTEDLRGGRERLR